MSETVQNVVVALVAALFGGGGTGFIVAWLQAKQTEKQRRDEAPERREALTIEGSAKAVLTMDQALEAANERAAAAEKDVKALRQDISRMKSEHRQEIDNLRTEHNREITDLGSRLRAEIDSLRAELDTYRNTGGTT